MPRRDAVPLFKTRHAAFVGAILNHDNPDKAIAAHLQVGTGARADTICHTHSSWFVYNREGALYYRIPGSDPCRKYGDHEPCGDCRRSGHDEYEPKTPAGEGRRILLTNHWTNPDTGEKEYFGLRDAVESYFALDGTHAPDGVQHGNEMVQGNGVSATSLNIWIREIAAQSTISATLRKDLLQDEIKIEHPDDDENNRKVKQIRDFGTDDDGNKIPDIISHDMRATFCTQLMRNDVSRDKAINKTGHKTPGSMEPYIRFAEGEIDEQEESGFY
jgi:hypothetical protein